MLVMLFILCTLTISSLNAWSVGRGWTASKLVGGLSRLLSWCGATMAAAGFTWVYLIGIALIAGPDGAGKLSAERVQQITSLGYLAIIGPVIGSGIALTVQSWAAFWRARNFGGGAIAAWNTYAEAHNIISAAHEVPTAWKTVGSLFDNSEDAEDAAGILVLILVALALGAGIVTTAIIVRTVAAKVERELALEAAAVSG